MNYEEFLADKFGGFVVRTLELLERVFVQRVLSSQPQTL